MNHLARWLAATLAFVLAVFGSTPSVAGDEPGRTDNQVKFSPSLGMDRPLDLMANLTIKLSRDGRRVAAVSRYDAWVWDGDSGRQLLHLKQDTRQHWLLDIHLDDSGRRIVTGGQFDHGYSEDMFRSHPVRFGSLANLWDGGSGHLARTFVLHERKYFERAAISANGSRVACADRLLNIKLWDAATGRELASFENTIPPDSRVVTGAFSDDATRFVALVRRSGANDQRDILFFELTEERFRKIAPAPLPSEGACYEKIAISGDGREVAVWVGNDPGHELAIFDFASGSLRHRFPGASCSFMAFSPDGMTIALGTDDGCLHVVDRVSGAGIELQVSDGPVRTVAFLPRRVRVVAERKFVTNAERSGGTWAGPMRIADFAVQLRP